MLKIYRYILPATDDSGVCYLELPQGAWILSASVEIGRIVIWAMINEMRVKTDTIQFLVISTGQTINLSPQRYLSTVRVQNLDMHIFVLSASDAKTPIRSVIRELKSFVQGA